MAKSDKADAKYVVGIDLGTTNSVVCYSELATELSAQSIQQFYVEQLVAPGEVARRPQLPSFRYHPAQGELPLEQLVLPWGSTQTGVVVGELARELGSKVEGRQVSSAKSWLSHNKVDATAPILPWSSAVEVEKVSPVSASACYLNHIRQAWNHEHPKAPLEAQHLVITVPASFDEMARTLTLSAAEQAGLPNILLLEEPQAVCYDWYHRHRDQVSSLLAQIKLLLVVDVGGGTTDLSLVKVSHDAAQAGDLKLSRIAVGDHWMLGGDNLDLAIARQAELQIADRSGALSAAALNQLVQQSRQCKELLMSESPPESAKVTLLGSGSKLLSGAKTAVFSQADIEQLTLDGFFPLVTFGDRPTQRRSAVTEFGLPYAPDPAISRYLSQFLSEHQTSCRDALGVESGVAIPDGLLLNGGVFKSPQVVQRVSQLLEQWRGAPVTVLANQHPDYAVAFGAAVFGRYRLNRELLIGGGLSRTYFIRVEQPDSQAVGVCLLPKGTETGTSVTLTGQRFALQVNQPVQFILVAYNGDQSFAGGELIALEDSNHQFVQLPPLVAVLDSAKSESQVEVELSAVYTEVGTLDIRCHGVEDQQQWRVEFELRAAGKQAANDTENTEPVELPAKFSQALDEIDLVYGASNKRADVNAVKQLRSTLEKLLGSRNDWDTAVARALFDALWERRKKRRRSVYHERVWINLSGFCLRPGFGHGADEWRLKNLWPLFAEGMQFEKESQSWAEWWTLWRRVAGGLDESAQQQIFQEIAKYIDPEQVKNRKIKTELQSRSYEDIVRLAASLENLPVDTKQQLGNWLSKRLQKASETATSWWALGRIASREPFHSSQHLVVPPSMIGHWLEQVLKQDWRKNREAAFAAVMMARVTDDRERDLSPAQRQQVLEKLQLAKAPESWQQLVISFQVLDEKESKRMFGEAMPSGLRLLA